MKTLSESILLNINESVNPYADIISGLENGDYTLADVIDDLPPELEEYKRLFNEYDEIYDYMASHNFDVNDFTTLFWDTLWSDVIKALKKLGNNESINESAEPDETEESLIKEVEREIEFCEEKLKDSSLKGQERTDTENDLNYAKKRLSDLQKTKTVDNIKINSDEVAFVNRVLDLIDNTYMSRCVNGKCSYRAFKNYWAGIIDRMNKYLDSDELKRFDKTDK